MDDVVRSSNPRQTETTPAKSDDFFRRAPTLSLPKRGGAIRGIGEKFATNQVTGTGSMSVPIYTSPGRLGFGPQLAMTYDSGAGNGPYGLVGVFPCLRLRVRPTRVCHAISMLTNPTCS